MPVLSCCSLVPFTPLDLRMARRISSPILHHHPPFPRQDLDIEPCRLTTRHWVITDGEGRQEEVRGPGVVGHYPVMRKGALFRYCSCSPQSTETGNMRGSFAMAPTDGDGDAFDVEVPVFEFDARPFVRPNERRDGEDD